MKQSNQIGQSSVEYAVICGVFAFVLGIGMLDDNSVLHELLTGLQTAYQKISYAMSLPN